MKKKAHYYGPRFARHRSVGEQFKYWLVCCAKLLDSVVAIVSLGFITMDLGPRLLFSDWVQGDE